MKELKSWSLFTLINQLKCHETFRKFTEKTTALRSISYEQKYVKYQLEIAFISSVMVAAITEKGVEKQREWGVNLIGFHISEKPQNLMQILRLFGLS
ncbi:hypothetical protein [Vibrio splendidus]|uniref:hypothetical protein n=1 Tax=Vibrio splendidus TaxID=29497 RepID=UPI00037F033A|nr:hypothetical protein [Vibrio splendidus]OED75928.1 hypothetical protein A144_06085 [Vibrio splendidus ZF-90]OEF21404.1 hypothetical protein A145_06785 [Vibrio splendidus 5S-101]PTP37278.1 hypothetical protein CWN95_03350 [Vibrio splendidus]